MSTSRPYHHGALTAAILDASRRLLDDVPAEELSVRELARAAGVSHAAPYRHFGDRLGFLTALAAYCFEEFLEAQEEAYDRAAPGERLQAVGLAYVEYGVAHPHPFALLYNANIVRPEDPPPLLAPLIAAHTALLGRCVEDAMHHRLITSGADPQDVGAALWSLAHGLTHLAGHGFLPAERARAVLAALLAVPGGGAEPRSGG